MAGFVGGPFLVGRHLLREDSSQLETYTIRMFRRERAMYFQEVESRVLLLGNPKFLPKLGDGLGPQSQSSERSAGQKFGLRERAGLFKILGLRGLGDALRGKGFALNSKNL